MRKEYIFLINMECLVGGKATGKIEFCEACIKGKQLEVKFGTN